MTLSPLAPASFPALPSVAGVDLATLAAGLRYKNRADLMLAHVAPGSTVAGVFTQSLCPSAPVDWCRKILPQGTGSAIVCNSGNANAFTGVAGETAAELTATTLANHLQVPAEQVFLASTGVIGEALVMEPIMAALGDLVAGLSPSDAGGWEAAANAIGTTDTFAKGAAASVTGGGVIVGIAKGSGMIAPDMATMLGFVFTDMAVSAPVLQRALATATEFSFNRITVDSDTSTSDTVLLFATGQAEGAVLDSTEGDAYDTFVKSLTVVLTDLSHQIVRDGEGATKFVTVQVTGAETDNAAKVIALSIANSPLVKTALAAEDANWGRIVMAVGKAGERADRDNLTIHIGDELVAEHGVQAPTYSEDRATEHLRGDEVLLHTDVGIGTGEAKVFTCDLTHGYIDINAGYRS
ncbi:MAG: bifunctional glutamate N-acetyltransferase/amino-acid acetyltransferase ArgJ [Acidimicrobiales bacterium]|jgi:glutamate N-acetyltransferase / amino-acid N-acetyltransferase